MPFKDHKLPTGEVVRLTHHAQSPYFKAEVYDLQYAPVFDDTASGALLTLAARYAMLARQLEGLADQQGAA